MTEWVIYNADLVNDGERFRGYLTIGSNGLIAEIGHGAPAAQLLESAANTYDADGSLLIPGLIDTHVHFREPGLTHKGSIASESVKALRGGVTSFIDMPNCRPATVDLETWRWKMARAAETSCINYAFYLGATADNIDMLACADYSQVAAVKLFLGSSTGNMLLNDDHLLRQLLTRVPALIAVHAESEDLINQGREWAQRRFGEHVPLPMHSVIRSRRACIEGTSHIVRLALQHDARIHVCHVSTAQELDLFTPGAAADKRITAETSANYLTYTCLDYPRLGTAIKCNPAIKLPSDRDALRRAVASGLIDTIATDHAPHTPADKQGDAITAASGIDSIERSLTMLLNLARDGHFTVEQLVEKTCHNPATIYRIDRRGYLRPGYHADLTLIPYCRDSKPQAVWVGGALSLNRGIIHRTTPSPLSFNP